MKNREGTLRAPPLTGAVAPHSHVHMRISINFHPFSMCFPCFPTRFLCVFHCRPAALELPPPPGPLLPLFEGRRLSLSLLSLKLGFARALGLLVIANSIHF